MKKQQLKIKLINFQKEIVSLTQTINKQQREFEEKEQEHNLELISLIDSFENIFNTLEAKEQACEKNEINEDNLHNTRRKVIKSCHRIYRKISRILDDKGVNKIEFSDNKAQPGLCKILETQTDSGKEDGDIVEIIKDGYKKNNQVIRIAEVTTIANYNKK